MHSGRLAYIESQSTKSTRFPIRDLLYISPRIKLSFAIVATAIEPELPMQFPAFSSFRIGSITWRSLLCHALARSSKRKTRDTFESIISIFHTRTHRHTFVYLSRLIKNETNEIRPFSGGSIRSKDRRIPIRQHVQVYTEDKHERGGREGGGGGGPMVRWEGGIFVTRGLTRVTVNSQAGAADSGRSNSTRCSHLDWQSLFTSQSSTQLQQLRRTAERRRDDIRAGPGNARVEIKKKKGQDPLRASTSFFFF